MTQFITIQDVIISALIALVITRYIEFRRWLKASSKKKQYNFRGARVPKLEAVDRGQHWVYRIVRRGQEIRRYSSTLYSPEELTIWVIRCFGVEEAKLCEVYVKERSSGKACEKHVKDKTKR